MQAYRRRRRRVGEIDGGGLRQTRSGRRSQSTREWGADRNAVLDALNDLYLGEDSILVGDVFGDV